MFNLKFFLFNLLLILSIIVPLLMSVAFLTLYERKILASMQRRLGPNVVGLKGMLQPFADGIKLIIKETIFPNAANLILFALGPIVTLCLSMFSWVVIPFSLYNVISDINLGLLYIMAISSLGVYGILIAGWASNSKYAFLGALRSAAQMVSYEVSIGIILLSVIVLSSSFNLTQIIIMQRINWNVIVIFPSFIMFLISILAETNRAPFDLAEAEGELVAGYNVEYSSTGFAFFFIAEYLNIILMSVVVNILFFGGWLIKGYFLPFLVFGIKSILVMFFIIWVRASVPRYRYNQLMRLGWKVFLPLSLSYLIFLIGIILFFFEVNLGMFFI